MFGTSNHPKFQRNAPKKLQNLRNYLKQSTGRLHFIADRILASWLRKFSKNEKTNKFHIFAALKKMEQQCHPVPSEEMTLELYMDPLTMVDQISACGLRHVGYGVPTEMFPPLVAAYTDATGPKGCETQKHVNSSY